jgi:hypothetical protein
MQYFINTSIASTVKIIVYLLGCYGTSKAGEREGQGGQNTRGPQCSEGPRNLGKMFVLFINALSLS